MEFVVFSIALANDTPNSVCQLGFQLLSHDHNSSVFDILLNPACEFDRTQIGKHCINPRSVVGKPQVETIIPFLYTILDGRIVVTFGDRAKFCVEEACYTAGKRQPTCRWIDLLDLASKALPEQETVSTFDLKQLARQLKVAPQLKLHHRKDAVYECNFIASILSHLLKLISKSKVPPKKSAISSVVKDVGIKRF